MTILIFFSASTGAQGIPTNLRHCSGVYFVDLFHKVYFLYGGRSVANSRLAIKVCYRKVATS